MNLSVQNLSFSYGDHRVLDDVSFDLEKGEFLSVLGPNSVGKSTLFRCILGLLTSYKGYITSDGKDLRTMPCREMAKRIAYIPQINRPTFGYTVLNTVLMGTTRQVSVFSQPKAEQIAQQADILVMDEPTSALDYGNQLRILQLVRELAGEGYAVLLSTHNPQHALTFASRILVLSGGGVAALGKAQDVLTKELIEKDKVSGKLRFISLQLSKWL